jgi:chaperone modulatory protein CbpM
MREGNDTVRGVILDDALGITLEELTRLCGVSHELLRSMVGEGMLRPSGTRPEEWRFSGLQVRRARRAVRLQRDLELNLAGAALALDLLEEIESLRMRIQFLEYQLGEPNR